MLKIENSASLSESLKREMNLFVGAGFSIYAKDKNGSALLTGPELVAALCKEFAHPSLVSHALPLVSQIIKSKDRARFNDFLVQRFRVVDFDQRHLSIGKLGIARIFTTNIDDLFLRLFEKNSDRHLNDLVLQGASFRDRSAVEFLPLHGSVSYPEPDFTFTPIEIASAFSNNPTQFQYLVSSLAKSPTLFLGYSFQDAGALQSLNLSFTSGVQEKQRWIQLKKEDDSAVEYFRPLGFNIIVGDTDEVLTVPIRLTPIPTTFCAANGPMTAAHPYR